MALLTSSPRDSHYSGTTGYILYCQWHVPVCGYRQPGRDMPAPGRRRGADGEQAAGGRNELHRLEVLHGGGSAGGQPGHGCTPSWQEQWVIWMLCVCVCVCACVCVCRGGGDELNHFNGCIPGLTVLLMLHELLNSFDTSNWSVNYCEIIHEWSHDSRCNFFSRLAQEDCYCVDLAGFSFFFFFFLCVFFLSCFSPFYFYWLFLLPFLSHQHSPLYPCGVFFVEN